MLFLLLGLTQVCGFHIKKLIEGWWEYYVVRFGQLVDETCHLSLCHYAVANFVQTEQMRELWAQFNSNYAQNLFSISGDLQASAWFQVFLPEFRLLF